MITETKKQTFYKAISNSFFHGKLSQRQVEGIEAIITEWNKRGLADLRWLAYMLATVYHETAKTMQPIEEYGRGAGKAYGQKLKMGAGPNKRIAYKTPNQLYYGRGFVQITWFENYEALGKLLKVDLLGKPELALRLDIATQILFEGMLTAASSKGDFTGHCLEQYFNDKVSDPVGARKIINGTDKSVLIAGYYNKFLQALL
jgi:putative chitinase